jgi:hypothetical protein
MKPLRAARDAGECARKQAAGARFGASNGLSASGEMFGDGLQRGHGMSFLSSMAADSSGADGK